ncbi:MAG: DedA family protein [Terriglobia bacterium]
MAHHAYLVLSHFFRHYGYWTVFIATLAENMGIPVPGDTALLFASFLARRGALHLTWAIAAGIAGSILGECIGFFIGRAGGRAFLERHRKKLLISAHRYERAQSVFLKHAGWAILVARFVSGLREIVGLLAGVFAMPLPAFLVFNVTSAVIWATGTGLAGYFLASSWKRVLQFLTRINAVSLIIFVAVVILLVVKGFRRRAARRHESAQAQR